MGRQFRFQAVGGELDIGGQQAAGDVFGQRAAWSGAVLSVEKRQSCALPSRRLPLPDRMQACAPAA